MINGDWLSFSAEQKAKYTRHIEDVINNYVSFAHTSDRNIWIYHRTCEAIKEFTALKAISDLRYFISAAKMVKLLMIMLSSRVKVGFNYEPSTG